MSKHKNGTVRRLLSEPGIAQSRPMNQPVDGALMTLDITQVLPYDRNPRRRKNPKYDDIKASIRQRGIEYPIKVTQRPGMPHDQFIISGGGNTRLIILHELSQETGDPRFQSHRFIYETWKSESSNLIAHLIENNERGEMILIDKARAIFEAKSLLEAETGERYTNRKLADALNSAGLSSVDRTVINSYEFALKTLHPVIPDLLAHGLGRPQINRISKLLNAAERLWAHHCPDEVEAFEPLFTALLARQNDADPADGWQQQFHADVVRELAQGDRNDLEKIRLQLDHLLNTGSLLSVDQAATLSPIPPQQKSGKREQPNLPARPVRKAAPQQHQAEKHAVPRQPEALVEQPLSTATAEKPSDADLSDEAASGLEPGKAYEQPLFKPGTIQAEQLESVKQVEDPEAIDAMRSMLFGHAVELAGIAFADPDGAQCVVSIDNGAGFFIREFPTLEGVEEQLHYPAIEIPSSAHNKHLLLRTANCLDFLLSLAEQFSPPATAVIESRQLYAGNALLASYHYSITSGAYPPGESESQVLQTWRKLFGERRHNSLTYSYYNLLKRESALVNQLMKELLDGYHYLTFVHCVQRGRLPLWSEEGQG